MSHIRRYVAPMYQSPARTPRTDTRTDADHTSSSLYLLIVLVFVLLTAACSSGPDHPTSAPNPPKASVSGSDVHGPVNATIDKHANVGIARLEPATRVWRLTSTTPVAGRVTVRLPLLRQPRPDEVIVALSAEHASGPWTPLAATIDPTSRNVVVTTTHFSWFTGLFADVGDAIRDAKRNIVDGLTSNNFAEADAPKCAAQAQARTGGYSISSDSKDTVYWCFGIESGRRILRVVDRRRYPLSVSHQGLTTLTQGHWNGLATLSRIGSGERAVIAPREAITFRVDAANGSHATLRTELDGFGQALYQLQIGVQTALDLMTAFGFKSATTTVDASAHLAGIADCATALENPTNARALLKKCLSLKNLIETFGARALLVAPIMVASGLIDFLQSEFNALGDQLNRRDEYSIRITTAAPTATTPPPVSPAACTAQALAADLARIDRKAGRTRFAGQMQVNMYFCTKGWADVSLCAPGSRAGDSDRGLCGNAGRILRDIGGRWEWVWDGDPGNPPAFEIPHEIYNELSAGLHASRTSDTANY